MDIGVWTRSPVGSNDRLDTHNFPRENHYICSDSKNYAGKKMGIIKAIVDRGANEAWRTYGLISKHIQCAQICPAAVIIFWI